MKSIQIVLSPYAYYARLNTAKFEEYQKQGAFKKWRYNSEGYLPYEFVEFVVLDQNTGLGIPEEQKKFGLVGCNLLCHNPFRYERYLTTKVFEPKEIIFESSQKVHFLFEEEQSSKSHLYHKYYTKEGQPFIRKISFSIDDSTCNLKEMIEYSDNSLKFYFYHLILRGWTMKPKYYSMSDFN